MQDIPPAGAAAAIRGPRSSPAGAYLAIILLSLVMFLASLDKMLVGIVIEPMKAEFGFSDTQIGMVSGMAFSIGHLLTAIPAGWFADRTNRRNLVAGAVLFWSVATGAIGLVANYVHMVIARFCVGVGEAAGQAAALTMVTDYFPPEKRATATTIYYLSTPIGGIIGFAAGGLIVANYGWRAIFYAAAIPGVILAALLLLIRDPERGLWARAAEPETAVGVLDAVRFFVKQKALFHLAAALSIITFVLTGVATWAPAYFMRVENYTVDRIGLIMAAVSLGTFAVMAIGGPLTDRLARRDQRWRVWIIAVCAVIQCPLLLLTFLSGSPWSIGFYAVQALFSFMFMGIGISTTQMLIPPSMRSAVAAIIFTAMGIFGFGFGPQFVGIASDALQPEFGNRSLAIALAAISVGYLWGAVHLWLAGRTLLAELQDHQD